MGKFFGTDGIRGVANKHPMTPELALALGKTVSRLWTGGKENFIVIGKDTRLSGDMLEHALVSGILSQGVNVWLSGIIPTPAVAFLTASLKAGSINNSPHPRSTTNMQTGGRITAMEQLNMPG